MTSLWRHLWLNYDTLDFKILTQCVKMLGERVLQVWRWYLQRFRRYRKKTRGGARNSPPSGVRVNGLDTDSTKVGIPNFVSGPREYIMEGEYVILAMCSWFRISWFRIICWHCWRASGNKWITYADLLRPLKNHGLIVFILTYTPWLLCHGFAF